MTCNNVTFEKCYNIGELINGTHVGGIVAENTYGSINIYNSYCLTNATYGGTLVSSNELKTYGTDEYLGNAYVNDDGRNDGYPILKWEKENR